MLFYPQEKNCAFCRRRQPLWRRQGPADSTSTTSGCSSCSARKGVLVRAFYYTALAKEQEFSPLRPLIDWLDYNGFTGRHQAAEGIHRRAGTPPRQRATWTSSSPST